jgi:hypothetical protein
MHSRGFLLLSIAVLSTRLAVSSPIGLYAITDLGPDLAPDEVVGQAGCTDSVGRALLWDQGDVYDLNSLFQNVGGWQLFSATDICNEGEKVGRALLDGVEHGFMLTPVPEPSSSSFLLVARGGLIVVMIRRSSRKSIRAMKTVDFMRSYA